MPSKAPNTPTTQKSVHQVARAPAHKPPSQAQSTDPVLLQCAIADPAHSGPEGMLALQRAVGNRATAHLIQTKLAVGPVGDRYEQEADRVAEQVVSGQWSVNLHQPAAAQPVQRQEEEEEVQTKPLATSITPLVQREAAPEEEEVQTKPLPSTALRTGIQRQAAPEEEEVQTKPLVQRQEVPEEEELQTKPLVQRQEVPEEEEVQTKLIVQREAAPEEEEVQTKPLPSTALRTGIQRRGEGGFEAGSNIEQRLATSRGGGSPLPAETREFMEPRFGSDFSGVRVHTGTEADQLNRQLSAQAFTHGQDIYMSAGKYNPASDAGIRLLAHELTHTIQQQAVPEAPVAGQPVQLQADGIIQRGIGDWFKKKFGKGQTPTAAGQQVAAIVLKVDRAHGSVGHSWVSMYYDAAHSPPTADQVNELGLLAYSKNRLLQEKSVPVGFWPLHTMRFATAEEESRKKQEYATRVSKGKTPGGGRSQQAGMTGFSTNLFKAWVPGRVEEPDSGHDKGTPDESRVYPVTQPQLKDATAYVNAHRTGTYSAYGIRGENCTSFAINVLKAAGQSTPDASTLGVSTPDILATGTASLNIKQPGPALQVPRGDVKAPPMTEDSAQQLLADAGLGMSELIPLQHMGRSLQQVVDSPGGDRAARLLTFTTQLNTPELKKALAMIMKITEQEVEGQLSALR